MLLHGLSFLSSMFIHQFIWSSPLSFLGCLMTLGYSCLLEMLSVSPRLWAALEGEAGQLDCVVQMSLP